MLSLSNVSFALEAEQESNGVLLPVSEFVKVPVPSWQVVHRRSGDRSTTVGCQGKSRNHTASTRLHLLVMPCPWPQQIRRPRRALFLGRVRVAHSSGGGRQTCRSRLCSGKARRALLQPTEPGRHTLPAMVRGREQTQDSDSRLCEPKHLFQQGLPWLIRAS